MRRNTNYLTIGCTLETKYNVEKALNLFNVYVKLNLMYFQNILKIKRINYSTLIKESMKDLIRENESIANTVHCHTDNFHLYLNDELILSVKIDY